MINTIQIKEQQFKQGFYSTGSGKEVILILGSCRSVPYLTYLNDWNNANGNRFTINFIDPFNWNWDINGGRVDYEAELLKQESNESLIEMLSKATIFIHEYYANAGMFNLDKKSPKNIYKYLRPSLDICTPNFNDIFILTRDIVSFDLAIKKAAIADYNVNGRLSEQTLVDIEKVRQNNLERFYDICSKTDFPEFAEIFANQYKKIRYWWTFNHVSKKFNQTIFKLMNDKFLHLENINMSEVDLYANNYTHLCEYDLGYKWGEPIRTLREIL